MHEPMPKNLVKLIGAAGALLIGLVIVIVKAQSMGPKIVVMSPRASDGISVSINGDAPVQIAAGGYHVFDVRKANHSVEIEDAASHVKRKVSVQVATNSQMKIVPGAASQCVVVFDITASHYSAGYAAPNRLPHVVTRELKGEPFTAPPETYFSLKTIPERFQKGGVNLAVEAPCEDMHLPDGELADAAGI
jgi:hypothetical protein